MTWERLLWKAIVGIGVEEGTFYSFYGFLYFTLTLLPWNLWLFLSSLSSPSKKAEVGGKVASGEGLGEAQRQRMSLPFDRVALVLRCGAVSARGWDPFSNFHKQNMSPRCPHLYICYFVPLLCVTFPRNWIYNKYMPPPPKKKTLKRKEFIGAGDKPSMMGNLMGPTPEPCTGSLELACKPLPCALLAEYSCVWAPLAQLISGIISTS